MLTTTVTVTRVKFGLSVLWPSEVKVVMVVVVVVALVVVVGAVAQQTTTS